MFYDKDFLLKLDKNKNRIVYARITALTFDERPIETIEGRITQGSINVDGDSAVRRTCSLTMVAQNFNYQNYYWGINTKFKLEVGLENHIDKKYPDIIWFKQGIFIFTSFNTSHSTNEFSISLQGKDKMCLLNGEVGGSLESSVDFGTIQEEISKGVWKIQPIKIYEIIRNAVHTYAGEPYHNIIINDLDDYGFELLEYRYDIPMYLYRRTDSPIFDNILLNGNKICEVVRNGELKQITLDELTANELDMLVDTLTGTSDPVPVVMDGESYYVAKIEYGQTAGYRLTDLTYAGDLIANVGESITSILDKIRNMLSEFEYFYDIDGQFIFQRKQSFVNTLWSPIKETDSLNGDLHYVESLATASAVSYVFNEGELITAFSNNPNLLNMRNDYSIWGARKSISGQEIPIHLRYAIDKKPSYYKNFNGEIFEASSLDWREIIYQMALDYYKYNTEDDFELKLIENNPIHYPSGRTGYERYYIDLQGFWRQIYNPFIDEELNNIKVEKIDKLITERKKLINEREASGNINYNKEKIDLVNELIDEAEKEYDSLLEEKELFYPMGHEHAFWNKDVYEYPHLINFWFDFLDAETELSSFNAQNVGSRSKSINETNIKSIYFRETPNIIFESPENTIQPKSGYKYIQVQDIDSMFSLSSQGKSAKDRLDELIYNHGYCIESATITTIPIYYLQPNTRIHISDQKANLNGDYVISKMTIPLTYNGTMSITATKAAESII